MTSSRFLFSLVTSFLFFTLPSNAIENVTCDNGSYFRPRACEGYEIDSFEMLIYNRWRELLFDTEHCALGWDGTTVVDGEIGDAPEGTYIWKFNVTLVVESEQSEFTGSIVLLRDIN